MHPLTSLSRISFFAASALVWSLACSNGSANDDGGGGGEGSDVSGTGGDGAGGPSGSGSSGSGDDLDLGSGGAPDDEPLGGAANGTGGRVSVEPGGASCDCGGVACQCSDGIDNDGDSPDGILNVDGLDIECTGACDNDEGSFATGIPGDNKDPHQDCFFDGDSGAGNDGCKSRDDPSEQCQAFCAPLTPNGCDCFGCCAVTLENGETTTVQLGGTCVDADSIDDPTLCEPCEQSEGCKNDCGECELCPGRDPADLPESCAPDTGSGGGDGSGGGPGYTCDDGAQACRTSADCDDGGYCQTGCCIQLPIF